MGARARACLSGLDGLAEGDEAPAPSSISFRRGTQAVARVSARDVVEDRVLVVGALQVVVRDLRAQVMDVMEADVPVKNCRGCGSFR